MKIWVSFNTKNGVFEKGSHTVDVYLDDIVSVKNSELYTFRFNITSNKGKVSNVRLDIIKDYPKNFSLYIKEGEIEFGRIDFEDHLGKIHSLHLRSKEAQNIFAYFSDIQKTKIPDFVAGLSGNSDSIFNTSSIFGFLAIALAAINIFGGFLVTQRMLAMYKKKTKDKK